MPQNPLDYTRINAATTFTVTHHALMAGVPKLLAADNPLRIHIRIANDSVAILNLAPTAAQTLTGGWPLGRVTAGVQEQHAYVIFQSVLDGRCAQGPWWGVVIGTTGCVRVVETFKVLGA